MLALGSFTLLLVALVPGFAASLGVTSSALTPLAVDKDAEFEDGEPPELIGITSANGAGTAGRMDAGDTITLEFDSAISDASLPANATVSLHRHQGNTRLTISGVLDLVDLGTTGYFGTGPGTSGNRDARFDTALSVVDERFVVITLEGGCTGNGCDIRSQGPPVSVEFAVTAGTEIKGVNGLTVTGSHSVTELQLF